MAAAQPTPPSDIPEIPLTETPPKRLTMNKEEFFTQADIWNDNLAYVWQPAYNTSVGVMNETRDWMISMGSWTQTVADSANSSASASAYSASHAKESEENAKESEIKAKASEEAIYGYVIPTEATYTPATIDSKVDMAEVLYITGA